MVLLFFLVVICVSICVRALLFFSFLFYLTGPPSHLPHRLRVHTHKHAFFLSLCLFFLSPPRLSYAYSYRFLRWCPCTYAVILSLLLLLLFIIITLTRPTNEEEKRVKIEDDDYVHRLAWRKISPYYPLTRSTSRRWTLNIASRQVCHNATITARHTVRVICPTMATVPHRLRPVTFIGHQSSFLNIINNVCAVRRRCSRRPISARYSSIGHVSSLLGILLLSQHSTIRHATSPLAHQRHPSCRNNMSTVRVSWTVVLLSNWLRECTDTQRTCVTYAWSLLSFITACSPRDIDQGIR